MATITKELAMKIVKKLGADTKTREGKAHDIAIIRHEGKKVAKFGIRRGSGKDLGHDHVPRQLGLRPNEARLLAECPMTRDEWVHRMREKGKI